MPQQINTHNLMKIYIPTMWTVLHDFLQDWVLSTRRRFVLVNNALSDSGLVKAGVSHLYVLGPLLILLYINDFTDNLNNLARLFSNDSSLSYSGQKTLTLKNQLKATKDLIILY